MRAFEHQSLRDAQRLQSPAAAARALPTECAQRASQGEERTGPSMGVSSLELVTLLGDWLKGKAKRRPKESLRFSGCAPWMLFSPMFNSSFADTLRPMFGCAFTQEGLGVVSGVPFRKGESTDLLWHNHKSKQQTRRNGVEPPKRPFKKEGGGQQRGQPTCFRSGRAGYFL